MNHLVAVVIPTFAARQHVLEVVVKVLEQDVNFVYVVDDKCPQDSGKLVENTVFDQRLSVLYNPKNLGVGGAVKVGFRKAVHDGAQIIVKIDSDGQMDPALISEFVNPIRKGVADYTKGNRFYSLDSVAGMPKTRIFGNAILSFFSKLSSGYWSIFDPANGYLAINAKVIGMLNLDKISNRYFFESDMLFRLNILRAAVSDIPMASKYEDEKSNLKVLEIIPEFLLGHSRNFCKRIFYRYLLRDFNFASLELFFWDFIFIVWSYIWLIFLVFRGGSI